MFYVLRNHKNGPTIFGREIECQELTKAGDVSVCV
jgi:hypothetical protein